MNQLKIAYGILKANLQALGVISPFVIPKREVWPQNVVLLVDVIGTFG